MLCWGLALFTTICFNIISVTKTTSLNAVISLVAKDSRLKESGTFYEKKVNSISECGQLCLSRYLTCKSINFKHGRNADKSKICELNNMTRLTSLNNFVTDENYDYLEPVQVQKDFKPISPEQINNKVQKFQPFQATFTNLGANGRSGPTTLGAHYVGQDHEHMVAVINGIQHWTVPYSGTYQIKSVGAAGGYDKNGPGARGRGAYMQGDFELKKGDVIALLVGQTGVANTVYTSSGGGGGTFVATSSNDPLLVAGGGGGIESPTTRLGNSDASTQTTGKNNQCNSACANWAGGVGGNGGLEADSSNSGGGGGGFNGNGRSSTTFGGAYGNGGEGGRGFLQGGTGGRSWYGNGEGGFGGGGGAYGNGGGAGGGGGYSGGASGDNVSGSCGGGGGSYNIGKNQVNQAGYNDSGHGYITIIRLIIL